MGGARGSAEGEGEGEGEGEEEEEEGISPVWLRSAESAASKAATAASDAGGRGRGRGRVRGRADEDGRREERQRRWRQKAAHTWEGLGIGGWGAPDGETEAAASPSLETGSKKLEKRKPSRLGEDSGAEGGSIGPLRKCATPPAAGIEIAAVIDSLLT
jgi:hypothetical protein